MVNENASLIVLRIFKCNSTKKCFNFAFYAIKGKMKHKCVSFSKRKMDANFASTDQLLRQQNSSPALGLV